MTTKEALAKQINAIKQKNGFPGDYIVPADLKNKTQKELKQKLNSSLSTPASTEITQPTKTKRRNIFTSFYTKKAKPVLTIPKPQHSNHF